MNIKDKTVMERTLERIDSQIRRLQAVRERLAKGAKLTQEDHETVADIAGSPETTQ